MALSKMLRRTCLAAILIFCISAELAAQAVSDGTNIDSRWNRTWPAGPFSQVSTSWGVLQTSIPLCSVDGPAGTSIGFSIYHRSNQTTGTQLAYTEGGAGRGWTTSVTQTIQAGTGATTWFQGANSTASWTIASVVNGVPTYARTAGTRADMVPIMQGGQIAGWDVTTQGDKTKYVFRQEVVAQAVYRLTQIIDTHGNTINFQYDSSDRVTRVTDASGVRYIQITYTADPINKQVASVSLVFPGGSRTWDFYYSNWHLDHIDFPAPLTGGPRPNVGFHYTSTTNIDDLYDLKGYRWHFAYGLVYGLQGMVGLHPPALSAPTTSWDLTGTTFAWSTYTSGPSADWTKTCTVTDRRGYNWKHVYYNNGGNDWFSNPIKQTFDGGFLANDLYTWNYADGTLASHVDRRGWTTSFSYDSRGNMLTKIDREGWLWQWIYYQDKVVTQIDPTLNRTIYAYYTPTWDLAHCTIDPKTDPFDGAYSKPSGVALKTQFTYTSLGEVASTWKGSDLPTAYSSFDAYGNSWTTTSPLGIVTTQTFDELSNKTSSTIPSPGGTTTFSYDNWNRLLRTTFPGGSYTENTYDNNGNYVSLRDPKGIVTTNYYNAWNWLGGTQTPVDGNSANDIVVEYFYDDDGHRIRIENGRDKSTYYDVNARGDVWRIRYPDGTDREFEYDGNGNRTKRWDGQNRLATYSFDKENRLVTTSYPNATTITNYWRSDGLRDRYTDPTGTTQYAYNGAKQVESVFQPVPNKTIYYDYDSAGRKLNTGLGAQTWSNVYDADGRLRTITQTVGATTPATFDYYTAGPLWRRINGNSTAAYYSYDSRLRTTAISHRNIVGGVETEQQRIEYTYDDNGNILTTMNAMVAGSTWNTSYTFDYANRLKSETRTGGVGFNFANAYNYDKSNNRTSVIRNGVISSYTVDDNDKLTSGDGYTLSGYSADGNPATVVQSGYGTITFQYDYENRPTRIDYPGGYTTFRYNGDGQRVEKIDSVGGVTTRFMYDGTTVIAETNGLNQITTFFLPGVGYNGSGGSQFYDRENALGSSLTTTNSAGAIQSIREYDAYGMAYQVQAGIQSPFKFAGKHGYYTDDATGLQLLGARYYLPKLGRFMTQDPIGQAGGLNLYGYCSNNPLAKVDPDGLQGKSTLHQFLDLTSDAAKDFVGGWWHSAHTTWGWWHGLGPTVNNYRGSNNVMLRNIKNSQIGWTITEVLEKNGWLAGIGKMRSDIGTWPAFFNTITLPTNGPQAQVGAVRWFAQRIGNTIDIHVFNKIGLNSAFFHQTERLGIKDFDRRGFGDNFGNVYQHFYWSIKVPSGK